MKETRRYIGSARPDLGCPRFRLVRSPARRGLRTRETGLGATNGPSDGHKFPWLAGGSAGLHTFGAGMDERPNQLFVESTGATQETQE